ncbi:hypothetical protein LTR78_001120 [Recurvomyces mirabilis]|uniref:RING-type domain-containing protein n=1 Tax=Recurvomyces mirabilis TaxID=574656 RepID=A0AAE0WUU2_9PEZI|nr:hypothetical protein LTR78_001120 [Recurvomyces mirabilis]KAK5161095.1 hypothetical protein LTS14_000891 [Recurvomyces mirabilis]
MATIFDGVAAFGLMNPDKHAITCVGNTQQRRRCRNLIAYRDVNAAKQILTTITAYADDPARLQRRLRSLATLCICKNARNGHLSQRDDIVSEWMAIMRTVGHGGHQQHLSTQLRPVDPYFTGGLQSRQGIPPAIATISRRTESTLQSTQSREPSPVLARATTPLVPQLTTTIRPAAPTQQTSTARPSSPATTGTIVTAFASEHQAARSARVLSPQPSLPRHAPDMIVSTGEIVIEHRARSSMAVHRITTAGSSRSARTVDSESITIVETDNIVVQTTERRSARLAALRIAAVSASERDNAAPEDDQRVSASTAGATAIPQASNRTPADQHSHTNTSSTASSSPAGIEICSICLDPVTEARETPCGHVYCGACIATWLDHSSSCPLDRRHLTAAGLRRPTRVLRKAVEGECPMCYEDIGLPSDENTVWCRRQCGTNFHRRCMDDWHESEEDGSTCPYCRAEWQE